MQVVTSRIPAAQLRFVRLVWLRSWVDLDRQASAAASGLSAGALHCTCMQFTDASAAACTVFLRASSPANMWLLV